MLRSPVKTEKKYFTVLDEYGKMRFNPKEYEGTINYSEDNIVYQSSGSYYISDISGNVISEVFYDNVGAFNNGLAYAKSGEKYRYIDQQGNVKIGV